MKKLLKLLVAVLFVGGWALAASAVHVVRTPGPIPYIGSLKVVPKDQLGYCRTFVDTTHWSAADIAANPDLATRAKLSAAACDAKPSCCPVTAQQDTTVAPTTQPTQG